MKIAEFAGRKSVRGPQAIRDRGGNSFALGLLTLR